MKKWLDCAVEVSEEKRKKPGGPWSKNQPQLVSARNNIPKSSYIQLMFFFFICAIIITLESQFWWRLGQESCPSMDRACMYVVFFGHNNKWDRKESNRKQHSPPPSLCNNTPRFLSLSLSLSGCHSKITPWPKVSGFDSTVSHTA